MAAMWNGRIRGRFAILYGVGVGLIVAGFVLLLPPEEGAWQNASTNAGEIVVAATQREPNYLGWGTLILGFFTLASAHYFKLRDARRADRAEAREIADRRRDGEDVY